jgi:hypothetical protein
MRHHRDGPSIRRLPVSRECHFPLAQPPDRQGNDLPFSGQGLFRLAQAGIAEAFRDKVGLSAVPSPPPDRESPMKLFVVHLGVAAVLLGFSGTASAQYGFGGPHHGHNHGFSGYHGGGWGGGHYHVLPGHFHYHADPWGGHYHYHRPRVIYHNGPDYIPAYRQRGGYPGYGSGFRPGGFGYGPGYYR